MATIDLYKTRTMLRALEQMRPPRTFLLRTFFNFDSPTLHDTDTLDIDIYKEKRRMAEFVDPKMQAKMVESRGFETRSYKPGYIKNKKITNAADLLNRQLGETTIYGNGRLPSDYAQQQVGKDLAELRSMATRRMEWMASQVLQTGKVLISGDGVASRYIDFNMAASHIVTLTAAQKWTAATGDPIKRVRIWKRLLSKESGITPKVCVLGANAVDAFINNTTVKALLDNRRIELGGIAPRDLGDGVTYLAIIEGVEYYEYNEYYFDTATSDDLPMVPDNGCIFGSPMAYAETHFGVIKDLDATAMVAFFPKVWEDKDPSVRYISVQTSPIIAMHQADAFLYATVV